MQRCQNYFQKEILKDHEKSYRMFGYASSIIEDVLSKVKKSYILFINRFALASSPKSGNSNKIAK